MSEYEMFKTTLMGGFDKDDVITKVQEIKDRAYREKKQLEKEVKARDEKIAELTKRLELKENQREKLEQDIELKYKKYIDNYDSIGRIILESRVQADKIVEDAKKQAQEILTNAMNEADRRMEEANAEANRRVTAVESEVNEKLADGKKKYIAVQDEMNEIVELINQAQRRFMASYKEVHRIVSSMPDSLEELEADEEEYEMQEAEEDSLDEADDLSEAEIEDLLSRD